MAAVSTQITLAVDVGGTFTDAVVATPNGDFTGKTPTTPEDQSIGVITAAELALSSAGLAPGDVESFVHGMTVTTNALLEGTFARTALLTTAGFTDLEELGRQNRADLYRLQAARPAPIVAEELRFGLDERCGPDGVATPLDLAGAEAAIRKAIAAGAESLAVCLLFAFRFPQHELAVREIAERVDPDLHVSLSHEAVGTFREYERLATTVIDAALAPLLSGYLNRLAGRAAERGLPRPLVTLSSGGTAPIEFAAGNPATTVLSGPAGGAVGAARTAQRAGATRAIGFDMGGTSTDICLVDDGHVAVAGERTIAGRPIALPAVDISTVGAGGGSIAWRDAGGALRVGPRSAGARPGPAAYGHGGSEPTVTDANLLLGYLSPASELADGLRLDHDAAERALAKLGDSLGLSALETARGVIEIANLEMLRKANSITVARGIDPRDHSLIAFGGAGPMHATAIAEALGIERVICPQSCGVLSAWGMTASGLRSDRSRSVVRPLEGLGEAELGELLEELTATAADDLGKPAQQLETSVAYDLRYAGQAFELTVAGDFAELADVFHAEHDARFGFSRPEQPVELVNLRVRVAEPGRADQRPVRAAAAPTESTRTAYFGGEAHPAKVLTTPPTEGSVVAGPALIELPEATIVAPPGWVLSSSDGDVMIDRSAR